MVNRVKPEKQENKIPLGDLEMKKLLLSPAEEEILKLEWRDMSSAEIAAKLGKKIANVSKTKGSIRRKINEGLERLARSLQLDYEELSNKSGRAALKGYHFAIDTQVYLP
jgi:DNA-binding CsgD family transcriptional regulator